MSVNRKYIKALIYGLLLSLSDSEISKHKSNDERFQREGGSIALYDDIILISSNLMNKREYFNKTFSECKRKNEQRILPRSGHSNSTLYCLGQTKGQYEEFMKLVVEFNLINKNSEKKLLSQELDIVKFKEELRHQQEYIEHSRFVRQLALILSSGSGAISSVGERIIENVKPVLGKLIKNTGDIAETAIGASGDVAETAIEASGDIVEKAIETVGSVAKKTSHEIFNVLSSGYIVLLASIIGMLLFMYHGITFNRVLYTSFVSVAIFALCMNKLGLLNYLL